MRMTRYPARAVRGTAICIRRRTPAPPRPAYGAAHGCSRANRRRDQALRQRRPARAGRTSAWTLAAGRGGGGDGTVRQRQVHPAEPHRRPGPADQRDGHRGRAAGRPAQRDRGGPVPAAADRHDLPVLQPARRPDRRRQRAAARAAGRNVAGGQARARVDELLAALHIERHRTPTRAGCPAGSGSGWRSPGRWSTGPRCCWPTSRPARWTPPPARRSASCCST